jgi:hypothetical protein
MRFLIRRTRPLVMCCVLAATAIAGPAAAQTVAGLKLGPAQARFNSSHLERSDWTTGLAVAAFATVPMVDELSFQAELLYMRKGGRVDLTWRGAPVSGTVRLDYLELPLLLRVDLPGPRARVLSAHGALGPSGALRVGCRLDLPDDSGTAQDCTDANGTAVRRFDFNLVGLAGVDIRLSRVTIVLEGRYHVGLITVDDITPSWGRRTQTAAVQVGVAVPVSGSRSRQRAELR